MKTKIYIYLILYLSLCVLSIFFQMWWVLVVLLILGCIGGFILLLAVFMELGFRNKFSDDFVIRIGWVINYFEAKGFQHVTNRNGGTEHPESVLSRNDTEDIIVRLNAPIGFDPTTITIMVPNQAKEWNFEVDADREKVYKELDCYF